MPPEAPRPMITTSVGRCLVAMMSDEPRETSARRWRREHAEVVGGDTHGRQFGVELLLAGGDGEPQTWVPQQVPSDEVRVAAVVRIAEHALPGMRTEHIEERRGAWREARRLARLHLREHGVLIALGQAGEEIG